MHEAQNLLMATGAVCHQWSYLEYLLSNAIWHILGLDRDTGIIVTGGMDILPRANMAIALAKHRQSEKGLIEALQSARSAIQGKRKTDGLMYRRNLLVHGVYSSRDKDTTIMIETHRGAGDRKRKPVTSDFAVQTSKDIAATTKALVAVFEKLGINCH